MTLWRLITDGEENYVPVNTEANGDAWIDVFSGSKESAEARLKRLNDIGAFKNRNLRIQEVTFEI